MEQVCFPCVGDLIHCHVLLQKGGRPSGWWQVFLLAFTTTLREGLESVIFLCGVSAGIDPRSIPIAGIVGVLIGIAVGVALYYT